MIEDAMTISTWMHSVMPNPEDNNEIYAGLFKTATETVVWADQQLDFLAVFHSNRSIYVKMASIRVFVVFIYSYLLAK
jgi:hypothetical protein